MRGIVSIVLMSLQLIASAQNASLKNPIENITRAQYIDFYAPVAVKEMLVSGVPASITLAQGILESGDGNSVLAREALNHFGIKCHGMWEGKKYHMDDDSKNECFRVYESVYDSYHDHSEFLKGRERYADLFKLKPTDYKGWAHGLKTAGYATNPKYPALLIKIIEENDLHEYDKMTTPPKGGIAHLDRDKKEKVRPERSEAIVSTSQRQMYLRNNIRYILIEEGDTYEKLENQLQMRKWQVLKYNDKPAGATLKTGELIYLQPKRSKNPSHSYHFVVEGETLRSISQQYGIKLKKLYHYNELNPTEEPVVGKKVWLRKRKSSDY